jgi:hypothetical protein
MVTVERGDAVIHDASRAAAIHLFDRRELHVFAPEREGDAACRKSFTVAADASPSVGREMLEERLLEANRGKHADLPPVSQHAPDSNKHRPRDEYQTQLDGFRVLRWKQETVLQGFVGQREKAPHGPNSPSNEKPDPEHDAQRQSEANGQALAPPRESLDRVHCDFHDVPPQVRPRGRSNSVSTVAEILLSVHRDGHQLGRASRFRRRSAKRSRSGLR